MTFYTGACAPGFVLDAFGRCKPMDPTTGLPVGTPPGPTVDPIFTSSGEYAVGADCGPDSFWDEASQSCVHVAIPVPPTTAPIHCPPGQFYDYLRGTCVAVSASRTGAVADCGPDSFWDDATQSCVHVSFPMPSTGPVVHCPPGQFYDYLRGGCVPATGGRTLTGNGLGVVEATCNPVGGVPMTWDPVRAMCVPAVQIPPPPPSMPDHPVATKVGAECVGGPSGRSIFEAMLNPFGLARDHFRRHRHLEREWRWRFHHHRHHPWSLFGFHVGAAGAEGAPGASAAAAATPHPDTAQSAQAVTAQAAQSPTATPAHVSQVAQAASQTAATTTQARALPAASQTAAQPTLASQAAQHALTATRQAQSATTSAAVPTAPGTGATGAARGAAQHAERSVAHAHAAAAAPTSRGAQAHAQEAARHGYAAAAYARDARARAGGEWWHRPEFADYERRFGARWWERPEFREYGWRYGGEWWHRPEFEGWEAQYGAEWWLRPEFAYLAQQYAAPGGGAPGGDGEGGGDAGGQAVCILPGDGGVCLKEMVSRQDGVVFYRVTDAGAAAGIQLDQDEAARNQAAGVPVEMWGPPQNGGDRTGWQDLFTDPYGRTNPRMPPAWSTEFQFYPDYYDEGLDWPHPHVVGIQSGPAIVGIQSGPAIVGFEGEDEEAVGLLHERHRGMLGGFYHRDLGQEAAEAEAQIEAMYPADVDWANDVMGPSWAPEYPGYGFGGWGWGHGL